jgi:hypothetical protein
MLERPSTGCHANCITEHVHSASAGSESTLYRVLCTWEREKARKGKPHPTLRALLFKLWTLSQFSNLKGEVPKISILSIILVLQIKYNFR